MNREAIQRMVNHYPGSIVLFAFEPDWIRPITVESEPLDRIAGVISEHC